MEENPWSLYPTIKEKNSILFPPSLAEMLLSTCVSRTQYHKNTYCHSNLYLDAGLQYNPHHIPQFKIHYNLSTAGVKSVKIQWNF